MKNRVQYEKESKIEICYLAVSQLSQGAIFDKSDNANSMRMLSPGEGM